MSVPKTNHSKFYLSISLREIGSVDSIKVKVHLRHTQSEGNSGIKNTPCMHDTLNVKLFKIHFQLPRLSVYPSFRDGRSVIPSSKKLAPNSV